MPLLPLLGVAFTWLTRIAVVGAVANEIKKFYDNNKQVVSEADAAATQSGMTADEKQKLVAATTYEQVEKGGENPDDFWKGLTAEQQEALKFSPQSLQADMGRTSFLGLSSAFLFAASLFAGGVGAIRGIPILLSTVAKIAASRKAGATALELMTIIEEGKILGIAKVWVPGLVSGIAAAGGWLTSSMTNNLNDASLWGRIFLGQAYEDYQKAAEEKSKLGSGSGTGSGKDGLPKTIIRIVEEKKPVQFIGTLFSAKLGSADSFERQVDDEITDMNDLREDVKINLNRWLKSLPARLGYSVVVRKDPVDEYGAQQSGIWATLTIFQTHISGKTLPIDTILLGPVKPQVRLELQKQTKSIENEIAGFVTATEVREIQVPSGSVDIFTPDGEQTTISGVVKTETKAPESTTAPRFGHTVSLDVAKVGDPKRYSNKEGKVLEYWTQADIDARDAKKSNVITSSELAEIKRKAAELEQQVANIPKELREGPAAVGFNKRAIGDVVQGAALRKYQTVLTDTPGTRLNVRAGAGTDKDILTKLNDGTLIGVNGDTQKVAGVTWLPILYMDGGNERSGYVAIDYVKAT